jgi:glycosyltransferase involved in cell wall biosynthesis
MPILTGLLLAGIIAAPLATIALFTPARRPRRVAGAWPAVRRLISALSGTAILAGITAAALLLLGVHLAIMTGAGTALTLLSLLWLPATRRWNARAHLAWAATVFLFLAYLAFILEWTFASHMSGVNTAGGLVLWLFEVAAAVLACAYLWELCDALGTQRWRRRITATTPTPVVGERAPFVSLHVPAHNEPPDMVIQTLISLRRIEYPEFEVICVDDNTQDEAMWRLVAEWCATHGVKFAHLQDWPGYKSGALNYALREMTDPRAELIGVVDSDYQIEPGFLSRCAPLFADPRIGFIQAPQDYRDWSAAPYYRRLYYSYKYFFAVSQPSRNERNGAIFAGTMGLIRRSALGQAGGWDEWCITEDAELSLRLLAGGWGGLHVDQSWGEGIMPLTFEALKGQRYRWCFGGIQILRMHWRSLLPGRRTSSNRLTAAQRWTYLAGALQWYGDLLGLAFYFFLLAGAVNLADGGGQLFRKLTPFLVATVPALVALGLVRAMALLRRGTGASWRDAIGAFFVWQSTSLVVARASIKGLFSRRAAFLRTPKTSENASFWQALRANWAETSLALLGIGGIAGALTRLGTPGTMSGALLAALLIVPTLGLAAAPVNSVAAQRAALPADLRQRRRTESLRERRAVAGSAVAASGAVAGLTAFGAVLVLLLAPGRAASPPNPLRPGSGSGGSPPAAPAPDPARTAPGRGAAGSGRPSPPAPTTPALTPSGAPSGGTATPSTSPSTAPSTTPSTGTTPSPTATPSVLPSVPASPGDRAG